jgi:hypothetical protein
MEVRNIMPPDDIDRWNSKRNDETFCKLFLQEGPSKQFIYTANPFSLNERLKVQQGVFTCHGDITRSFADNLTAMSGWEQSENVLRICLTLEREELYEFAERLLRMNLDSASLFQGSDGLGRSLGDRMFLFAKLAVASAPGT